jgi:hypothetical protein
MTWRVTWEKETDSERWQEETQERIKKYVNESEA